MLAREHETLLLTATDVIADLRGFQGRLNPGRVANAQHDEFAERARSLAIYLSSALRLAAADEYISAYAVLRAALEHHLTDRLLFIGNRYKQQFAGVKKPTISGWRGSARRDDLGPKTSLTSLTPTGRCGS